MECSSQLHRLVSNRGKANKGVPKRNSGATVIGVANLGINRDFALNQ